MLGTEAQNLKEFSIQWLELCGFLQGSSQRALVCHQIHDNILVTSKMSTPLKVWVTLAPFWTWEHLRIVPPQGLNSTWKWVITSFPVLLWCKCRIFGIDSNTPLLIALPALSQPILSLTLCSRHTGLCRVLRRSLFFLISGPPNMLFLLQGTLCPVGLHYLESSFKFNCLRKCFPIPRMGCIPIIFSNRTFIFFSWTFYHKYNCISNFITTVGGHCTHRYNCNKTLCT